MCPDFGPLPAPVQVVAGAKPLAVKSLQFARWGTSAPRHLSTYSGVAVGVDSAAPMQWVSSEAVNVMAEATQLRSTTYYGCVNVRGRAPFFPPLLQ